MEANSHDGWVGYLDLEAHPRLIRAQFDYDKKKGVESRWNGSLKDCVCTADRRMLNAWSTSSRKRWEVRARRHVLGPWKRD
ncbi:hypothetical protein ACLOJK_010441 [Asimina triloba]